MPTADLSRKTAARERPGGPFLQSMPRRVEFYGGRIGAETCCRSRCTASGYRRATAVDLVHKWELSDETCSLPIPGGCVGRCLGRADGEVCGRGARDDKARPGMPKPRMQARRRPKADTTCPKAALRSCWRSSKTFRVKPTTVAETLERKQKLYGATEAASSGSARSPPTKTKSSMAMMMPGECCSDFGRSYLEEGRGLARRRRSSNCSTTSRRHWRHRRRPRSTQWPRRNRWPRHSSTEGIPIWQLRCIASAATFWPRAPIRRQPARERDVRRGPAAGAGRQSFGVDGTLFDGTAFDWAKYRGKVVLIDFWATWCGPCGEEMPNVQRNFDRYHDRGFEVVGVSLDDDRDALAKFLEREPPPWPTLHDGGFDDTPLATRYGIMGIPTMILVDQQGNVVSIRARDGVGQAVGEAPRPGRRRGKTGGV